MKRDQITMMELRPRPHNVPAPNCDLTDGMVGTGLFDIETAIAQLVNETPDSLPDVSSNDAMGIADLMLPISEPPEPDTAVVPDPVIEELPSPELNGFPLTRYAIWQLAHSTDDYAMGRGLITLGMACGQNDLHPLAHYYCAIAADIFRGLRSQPNEADALYHAGIAAYQCDCLETAILLLERARILNLVTNRVAHEAWTLLKLGEVYTQMNQGKAALCSLLDSWTLQSELDNPLGEMLALVWLGWIYETEDMPLSALDSYRQAIALYLVIEPSFSHLSLPRHSSQQDRSMALDTVVRTETYLSKRDVPPKTGSSQPGCSDSSPAILNDLILRIADVLYQAGELHEALTCYRQVIWCDNQ